MSSELFKIAGNIEDDYMIQFFKRFDYVKSLELTEGNVVYDAIINNDILVECKVRKANQKLFNIIKKEGVILEEKKLRYLMKAKQRLNGKAVFYINFFPTQNKVYLWRLDELDDKTHILWMNDKTYSYNSKKVKKEVYLLDINEALQFDIN